MVLLALSQLSLFLLHLLLPAELVIRIHDGRVGHEGLLLFRRRRFRFLLDDQFVLVVEQILAVVLFGDDSHMHQIEQAFFVQNLLVYGRALRPRIETLFLAQDHGGFGDAAQVESAPSLELLETCTAGLLANQFVSECGEVLCCSFEFMQTRQAFGIGFGGSIFWFGGIGSHRELYSLIINLQT